ncbi:endonuclease/exonuclease/phosphatase family protein [Maioricimonas rarisocia]|nr:endonuclease/exonuclease/phosphatase family protein [Maioricimonas rarisocia]
MILMLSLNQIDPSEANDASPAPLTRAGKVVRWLWYGLVALCVLLAATALLPLLPVNWWWVRIGDFPRVQLLLAYLIVLPMLIPFFRRRLSWVLGGLLLAGVGIQLYWIFPYLPVAPQEVQSAGPPQRSSRLRIVTANVLQKNTNASAVLELIRNESPDVVVLCEVNHRWIRDLAPLDEMFPYHEKHPLENKYGIALYSRYEVTRAEVRAMVKEDIPSIDARIRLPSGHEVRLFAVHPNPPRPGESTVKRDAELVLVGREVRDNQSVVVLGDMNDVGWSRTTNLFQEVSGLLDPRKGRGLYPTFNARSTIWQYPLDHLFHTDDFRVAELRTLSYIGSDHYPLLVELVYAPDAEDEQEAPDLDQGDREDAEDAVEAARAKAGTDLD